MIHISSLVSDRLSQLELKPVPATVGYHLPCHLKVQPDAGGSLHLLSEIPGIEVIDLQGHCCGIAGSWGMAAAHFDLSRRIGTDLTDRLSASGARIGVTDCPTCRMQMEQFSPLPIRHPVEILADRLPAEG